jgi:hypothetical protein
MFDARERGDRNPGAVLPAHELPPTLVEHGVVAQAEQHEIGAPRRDANDFVMGAGHKLTLITSLSLETGLCAAGGPLAAQAS